jgi:hypothetical protein
LEIIFDWEIIAFYGEGISSGKSPLRVIEDECPS